MHDDWRTIVLGIAVTICEVASEAHIAAVMSWLPV